MARRAAAQLAALLCLVGATCALARSQSLQRLTVLSFDLAADTGAPQAGVPFHLIVTLRVRERAAQIENLDLPMLAQLELLGDERETVSGPRGTRYRETITVIAHDAGPMGVAPATLQAIDSRDGKAKEWYTNGLTLRIAGTGGRVVDDGGRALLLGLVMIGLGTAMVFLLVRRRRRVQPAPARAAPMPVCVPAPPVERSRRDRVCDALAVLRAERTRVAAVTVRTAIWRMAGATDGETLGDVLRRPDSRDPITRGLLIALERAAFTYDEDLPAAIVDACSALERYVEETR